MSLGVVFVLLMLHIPLMLVDGFAYASTEGCDTYGNAQWACGSPLGKMVDGAQSLRDGSSGILNLIVSAPGDLGQIFVGFLQMMVFDYAFLTDQGGVILAAITWILRLMTLVPLAGLVLIALFRRFSG